MLPMQCKIRKDEVLEQELFLAEHEDLHSSCVSSIYRYAVQLLAVPALARLVTSD
jgi:hypothetical protein